MSTIAQPRMRLTARGRFVVGLLVALPIVAASILWASPGATAGSEVGQGEYYTVLSGESLWDIAQEIAPESDPRHVIDEIISINGLSGTEVFPGDQILLPSQY